MILPILFAVFVNAAQVFHGHLPLEYLFDLCHLCWRACDDSIIDANHNLDVLLVVSEMRRMSNHLPDPRETHRFARPIVKLLWCHPVSKQCFLQTPKAIRDVGQTEGGRSITLSLSVGACFACAKSIRHVSQTLLCARVSKVLTIAGLGVGTCKSSLLVCAKSSAHTLASTIPSPFSLITNLESITLRPCSLTSFSLISC